MQPKDIVYLVPTRGRPGAVPELIKAWEDTGARASLIFYVDDDDPCLDAYQAEKAKKVEYRDFIVDLVVGPRLRLAGTLNKAAASQANDFSGFARTDDGEEVPFTSPAAKAIGFMGDDHRPRTKGWDQRFAECLSGGAGVVYGNDLLVGARFPSAVCMTSDIPRTLGYFCPPGFTHLCLDLVWKDWGDGMGRITYLDDVVIEHMHPANGKSQLDAGYTEVNSHEMVAADSAAYFDYRDNHLPADLEKLRQLL